jgi:hypothetical protein
MSDSLLSQTTGGEKVGHEQAQEQKCHGIDQVLSQQEEVRMRLHVAGMVEKKTFIGLVSCIPDTTQTRTTDPSGASVLRRY